MTAISSVAGLWISLGIVSAVLSIILGVYLRCRARAKMLLAVLHSVEKPLLFYNEYGRLVFHSSGLVLFDQKSFKAISSPPAAPTKSQQVMGEIIIDFNRYRYIAKLLEYKPATYGTLVLLEYQGSQSASKS